MTTNTVLGLDLSQTATGCALVTPTGTTISTISRPGNGPARLVAIREVILAHVLSSRPDLVVIEGYAMGLGGHALIYAGEIGAVVRIMLHEVGQRYVLVSPSTLKKYATGKGNAKKAEVFAAAIRRLGYEGNSHDEADALWLAYAGHAILGAPLVDLPKTHTASLDALTKEHAA